MKYLKIIVLVLLTQVACKSDKSKTDAKTAQSDYAPNDANTPPSKLSFPAGEFDPRITQATIDSMLKYFDERAISGFQFDPRGFMYLIKKEGTGKNPDIGQEVTVNYQGRLTDDKEFDSTYKTSKPLSYKVGKMIPGFDAAVMLLKPGGKGLFVLPPFLAYENKSVKGPDGKELIPPGSKLVFEIELMSIK